MRQELIEELCGRDGDPFTAEVMTWLPDEAFDEIKNIKNKADEEGADQTTRNIQEKVLKKYLPEAVFDRIMEIDNQPWEKSYDEWEQWALEKVREIGRELTQNSDMNYRDFIRRLNVSISKTAVNTEETGMAIESIIKGLSDDDLNSVTKKLISEQKRRIGLNPEDYKKQKNIEKQKRYKENHNNEYEACYMKVYRKWYTRIRRAKEKGKLSGENLRICNDIFSTFISESYEKRNNAANSYLSPEAFSQWISDFEARISMFWKDIQ